LLKIRKESFDWRPGICAYRLLTSISQKKSGAKICGTSFANVMSSPQCFEPLGDNLAAIDDNQILRRKLKNEE
jgi:hypothetical protein